MLGPYRKQISAGCFGVPPSIFQRPGRTTALPGYQRKAAPTVDIRSVCSDRDRRTYWSSGLCGAASAIGAPASVSMIAIRKHALPVALRSNAGACCRGRPQSSQAIGYIPEQVLQGQGLVRRGVALGGALSDWKASRDGEGNVIAAAAHLESRCLRRWITFDLWRIDFVGQKHSWSPSKD